MTRPDLAVFGLTRGTGQANPPRTSRQFSTGRFLWNVLRFGYSGRLQGGRVYPHLLLVSYYFLSGNTEKGKGWVDWRNVTRRIADALHVICIRNTSLISPHRHP